MAEFDHETATETMRLMMQPRPVGHESPFSPPLEVGVAARVILKRSAVGWLADIEAYLTEQEMPVSLAESVAKVMDVSGWSCAETVARFREAINLNT